MQKERIERGSGTLRILSSMLNTVHLVTSCRKQLLQLNLNSRVILRDGSGTGTPQQRT